MKLIKSFLVLLLFSATLSIIACGGSNAGEGASEENMEKMEADKSGPEYTSAYVCPMHCKGSGSDQPGTCPVCKMDYVANEDHQNHDDHEGHNH